MVDLPEPEGPTRKTNSPFEISKVTSLAATVTSSSPEVPVDVMVKRHGGATYVFAVCMRAAATTATFTIKGLGKGTAEVLGEDRKVPVADGAYRRGRPERKDRQRTAPSQRGNMASLQSLCRNHPDRMAPRGKDER